MIVLTIRTDKPESEIGLFQDGVQLAYEKWEAHRALAETLHNKIDGLLAANQKTLDEIQGIVLYKGPGSFTGLRIGASVANALAYSLSVPVIGTSSDKWIEDGIRAFNLGQNDKQVLPEYGAPVFTTQPKK